MNHNEIRWIEYFVDLNHIVIITTNHSKLNNLLNWTLIENFELNIELNQFGYRTRLFCAYSLPNLIYKLINIVFSQHIYTLSSKPSLDFHDLRTFGRTNYHWNLRIFPANSLLAVKQTPHTFRILDVWPKPLGKITLHLSSWCDLKVFLTEWVNIYQSSQRIGWNQSLNVVKNHIVNRNFCHKRHHHMRHWCLHGHLRRLYSHHCLRHISHVRHHYHSHHHLNIYAKTTG